MHEQTTIGVSMAVWWRLRPGLLLTAVKHAGVGSRRADLKPLLQTPIFC
jgi:hypothetical protein